MSFNMNQFGQTQNVGQLDLNVGRNPSVFSFRLDPDSAVVTTELPPGTGILLVDGGADDPGGVPLIDVRSADGDAIDGVVLYNSKKNDSLPGDVVEVASSGSVVVMNSGAAIARGALVALVLATPGNVVTRVAETVFGKALDKASGANVKIRVKLA